MSARTQLRNWAALLVLNTALGGALRIGGVEGESSALRVGSPRSVASAWSNPLPLELQTVFRNGSVAWTRGAYSASNMTFGTGSLTSPGGSVFLFSDAFSDVSDAGFTVARTVAVTLAARGDEVAFATQFSLPAPDSLARQARLLFLPGVSYENASALPRGAIAGDPLAAHILVREDRLPLPLALAFFPSAGAATGAARLVHLEPDGSTIANEDFTSRIVDAGLQFGSLGFLNEAAASGDALPRVSLAFQYPGSEQVQSSHSITLPHPTTSNPRCLPLGQRVPPHHRGDRTYVYDPSGGGWTNRSHPIAAGVPHAYKLRFDWDGESTSFYAAARLAWRAAFDAFAPQAPAAPSAAQLYSDEMDVLAHYAVEYGGVPSVPFEAALPNGSVFDTSSQMGFVGRALPCAALLFYDAVVAAPNATRRAQAEAVVDLWAAEALNPCGSTRTWYNIAPGAKIEWRGPDAYQGSLRIMADGMKGMLDAYGILAKDAWLAAAVRFGDFLVRSQAADGSIATAWDWSCRPLANDKRQTPHAVPFLASLFAATKDARYRDAAVAAGDFSAALFADQFCYNGGAVDNPDVPDKEAGWLSTQAFIALYEMTGNASWLGPAAQAATYTETFVYAWNVPIPCVQSPPTVYPCHRTTLGASIIATGQSGADNFMSIAHHDFRRLGAWLDDAHFTAVADLLEASTTQVIDWDASLGYAMRGLMTEAVSLSVRRGSGVQDWLPWLTANVLYPLVQQRQGNATRRAGGG